MVQPPWYEYYVISQASGSEHFPKRHWKNVAPLTPPRDPRRGDSGTEVEPVRYMEEQATSEFVTFLEHCQQKLSAYRASHPPRKPHRGRPTARRATSAPVQETRRELSTEEDEASPRFAEFGIRNWLPPLSGWLLGQPLTQLLRSKKRKADAEAALSCHSCSALLQRP